MDRYSLGKLIGEGTYGIVYKAKEKETNEQVAIKRFKSVADEQLSKRELQACSKLNHPNIVTFRHSFRSEGLLHLVFDFAQTNMAKLIHQNPQGLTAERAKRLTYQLCKAIHCCHMNSIIHRDIKPENILLDKQDNVKLCDFGVARTIEYDGGPLSDYVATRWYRPPELELRSDIWSIGCILVELLTGKPLFPGESQIDQIHLIQSMLGPLPKTLVSRFTKALKRESSSTNLSLKYENQICSDGLDFLDAVLRLEQDERLSSEECLDHIYFRELRQKDLVDKRAKQINCKTNGDDNIEEEITYIESDEAKLINKCKFTNGSKDFPRNGLKIRGNPVSEHHTDSDDIVEIIAGEDKLYEAKFDRVRGTRNSDGEIYEDDFEDDDMLEMSYAESKC